MTTWELILFSHLKNVIIVTSEYVYTNFGGGIEGSVIKPDSSLMSEIY